MNADDVLEYAVYQEAMEMLFDLAADDKNLRAVQMEQMVLWLADRLDVDDDEVQTIDFHVSWLSRYREAVEAAVINLQLGLIEQDITKH